MSETISTAEERFRLLVQGATHYAMILLDEGGHVTDWNKGAERIMGWTEAEVRGLSTDLIFTPEDRAAGLPAQEMQRARAEGKSLDLRWHLKKDGSRFFADGILESLNDGEGNFCGFAKILRDATASKVAENDLHAVRETTARILESITDAFFTLDHEYRFTYVNREAERVLFRTRDALLGRYIWGVFPEGEGSTFDRQYRLAVAEGVPVSFEEFYPPLDTWFDVRAYPWEDGISVFFQDVSGRKRAEAERERLLAQTHTRAERESLLNRISAAIRLAREPDQVLETALRELNEAIQADRCYYAAYDQEADTATVGPEWRREGLPAIAGQYRMSPFTINRDPIYKAGRTQAVADTGSDAATRALGLRALVRVPLVSGTAMTALAVAMADAPREWTADEIALVEAVATLTQTALEALRLRQREHNIAEQLQAALQPDLPEAVPGIKVARWYEPALTEEAGVGGDFYDVFAIDKGCTALVVGDLSGKGLVAAANVSIVRNMLRAFLYSKPTVAEAVSELNRVLTENNLLTGFSTLFVGAFDAGTRVLKFVNAGQEPALVRRAATGQVEHLPPTGPILGSIESAEYTEETWTLARGDAIAIFSDGLTEIGPSRTAMLGIEGVASLLGEAIPEETGRDAAAQAEHLLQHLIAGVNAAAAGGVTRDDMCLLVAVVE